jgi:hypothetical protein
MNQSKDIHSVLTKLSKRHRIASVPEGATLEIPLDIVLSLLRPDELEKLQKYIASYLAQHGSREG